MAGNLSESGSFFLAISPASLQEMGV